MSDEMKLPDNKSCADCIHANRCTKLFGVKLTNTECDFYPIAFRENAKVAA